MVISQRLRRQCVNTQHTLWIKNISATVITDLGQLFQFDNVNLASEFVFSAPLKKCINCINFHAERTNKCIFHCAFSLLGLEENKQEIYENANADGISKLSMFKLSEWFVSTGQCCVVKRSNASDCSRFSFSFSPLCVPRMHKWCLCVLTAHSQSFCGS